MYVVFIRSDLHKVYFVPQRNAPTDGFEGFRGCFREHIPAVLHGTNHVVQEQRLIVASLDMIGHSHHCTFDSPKQAYGAICSSIVSSTPSHKKGPADADPQNLLMCDGVAI